MLKSEEYFESNFIIWNSELGIRDIVTIGKTEVESDTTSGSDEEFIKITQARDALLENEELKKI